MTPLPHISPPVSATADEARPRFSSRHFVITPSVPSLFPKTNPNGARGKDEIAVLSLQPNQHRRTPRRAQTDRMPTLPTSPLVTSTAVETAISDVLELKRVKSRLSTV
ncbi:hypothetical protein BLNAU_14334 [Blattamonas nauphoetae]|uniref:Uncharacterized protein n=1 Tax=Blattamonas nauphoetae TaxID=2049346 RepID=A0ABQ9XDV8_9EUKA|nr:hypothetical protein BLNAU_14334 [Blattamonas nauphoetae]